MVTLTGKFTRLDGDPATGTVKITPSRSPILDSTGKVIISGPQVFPLDGDGKLAVNVPASNDPDLGPPFTYTVEALLSHKPWKISKVWIPHGSATVDLSEIGDYTPTPGVATRVVTIPADGEDGQVLVWDGAGFSWGRVLGPDDLDRFDAQVAAAEHAAQRAEAALAAQPMDAGELIASRLSFRQGDITVGIASDSTSNDPTDWVRLWEAHLAERYPHLRIENNQWNSTTMAYDPTTVVQEGEGEPAFSGRVLHDTFTRTTGIADADEGGPWGVRNPDNFILTGESAYNGSAASGSLSKDVGSRDFTSQTNLLVKTLGTGNLQFVDIVHGADSNGVALRLTISPAGAATAHVFNRVDSTGVALQSVGLATLPGWEDNSDTWQTFHVEMQGDIQNYRATLSNGTGETTVTWTLPEANYSAMPTNYVYVSYANSPGIQVSEVELDVANRPATYQTLRVWSGTMGGGRLQYQIDNWDAMFGDELITPGTDPETVARTFTDTFARTGALDGSSADTGESWTGSTAWTTDGEAAVSSGGGKVFVSLPDVSEARWDIGVVTAPPATTQILRLGIHTLGDGVHGIYVGATVNTNGELIVSPYVRTPTGGYRPLGAITGHDIIPNIPEEQTVPITATLNGPDLEITAGAATSTYTITDEELAELGDEIELQAASGDMSRLRVLSVEADYTTIIPGTDPVYGDPLDVMIIGHGHNYGTRRGPEFITILEGFLGHMRDRRPSTLPLLSSQNPQFPPTANPGPHADRQFALRRYARENRYRYAPVFEHFAAQPDGGKSWVNADGVHPTGPATPTPTPGTGMSEWGKVLADTVTD